MGALGLVFGLGDSHKRPGEFGKVPRPQQRLVEVLGLLLGGVESSTVRRFGFLPIGVGSGSCTVRRIACSFGHDGSPVARVDVKAVKFLRRSPVIVEAAARP